MHDAQRIHPVFPSDATGYVKSVYETLTRRVGSVPPLMRAMAAAPAVLDGYLAFSRALANGTLSLQSRERIALAVSQYNGAPSSVAAHITLAKAADLPDEEIEAALRGTSSDPKNAAILALALSIAQHRGHVADAEIEAARAAGVTEGELAEIVANVALFVLVNYFNTVAGVEPVS